MRLIKVKDTQDLPDLGVTIDFQITDDAIEAIVLTSISDPSVFIRITKVDTYSTGLKVLKEEGLVDTEVWTVQGKLLGLSDYYEEFEDEYSAQQFLDGVRRDQGVWDEDKLGLRVVKEIKKVVNTKLK